MYVNICSNLTRRSFGRRIPLPPNYHLGRPGSNSPCDCTRAHGGIQDADRQTADGNEGIVNEKFRALCAEACSNDNANDDSVDRGADKFDEIIANPLEDSTSIVWHILEKGITLGIFLGSRGTPWDLCVEYLIHIYVRVSWFIELDVTRW